MGSYMFIKQNHHVLLIVIEVSCKYFCYSFSLFLHGRRRHVAALTRTSAKNCRALVLERSKEKCISNKIVSLRIPFWVVLNKQDSKMKENFKKCTTITNLTGVTENNCLCLRCLVLRAIAQAWPFFGSF